MRVKSWWNWIQHSQEMWIAKSGINFFATIKVKSNCKLILNNQYFCQKSLLQSTPWQSKQNVFSVNKNSIGLNFMNSLKLQFRLIFSIVIIYTNWSNKPQRSFRVILSSLFILGFYEDHIWITMVYQINKIMKQFHICYQWHSIGRGSLSLSVTLPALNFINVLRLRFIVRMSIWQLFLHTSKYM